MLNQPDLGQLRELRPAVRWKLNRRKRPAIALGHQNAARYKRFECRQ
jgi:hypothetical protein